MQTPEKHLSALKPGETARVAKIQVKGTLRRRLFDLGLIPGTVVLCQYTAPSGSPAAFLVRGTLLALRRRDAENIVVEADA